MPVRRKLVLSPANGTRFRLYVQSPEMKAFRSPELVRVSLPPDKIQPGPADDRVVIRRALAKPPYTCEHPQSFVDGDGREWLGLVGRPVSPGPRGHFDHFTPDMPEFAAAATYATVRRVIDIWDWYFGKPINWFFRRGAPADGFADDRLEIVPFVITDTAHSGFGFVEFGSSDRRGPQFNHEGAYWRNFDVVAHELGHQFIYAAVGFPAGTKDDAPYISVGTPEFRAFHESAGDLIALISTLHFESVRKHLLDHTAGNLGTFNEVSRIGELGESFQFRSAFNYSKVSLAADGSIARLYFSDPAIETADGLPAKIQELDRPSAETARETQSLFYYRASQVVTGAVFDTLTDIFQSILVAKKLIPAELARSADATWDLPLYSNDATREKHKRRLAAIHRDFKNAYAGNAARFDKALCTARDFTGRILADHWATLSPDNLNFLKLGSGLKAAAARADRAGLPADLDPAATVATCFGWRGLNLDGA
jgi:hypothetical protein